MADALEPVVFEVLAEINSAQSSLAMVQEELSQTAAEAQAAGVAIAESLTNVEGSMGSAAAAASEAGAFIASSMGDVSGSLDDAAGAAADASGSIANSMNDISSEAESAGSSIDDASGGMADALEEVSTAVQGTASATESASSVVAGAMDMVGVASKTAAEEVVAAQEEIGAAATIAGNKMVEEGAKARTAGRETAAGGREGAAGIKGMAEAFGAFAAFDFLKESVKDSMAAEGAMNILDTAIRKTGGSAEALAPQIESVDSHMKSLGFTGAQSNQGLARLTQMLGNSTQAMRLEGLAADLSRAKQIDFSAAIRTVGMAATGHVGLLARMGLKTKDAAGHTLSAKAAIDAMAKSFQGTAQSYAGTMAGKMQVFKADMDEARVKVGTALIPALQQLTPLFVGIANVIAKDVAPQMASAAKFYKDHKGLIDKLALALGALWLSFKVGRAAVKAYEIVQGLAKTAQFLYTAATKGAKVAQAELNTTMEMNPIGMVVAALTVLALGFVYAWKHSETFRNVVTGTWHAVETVVGNAVAAIINYYLRPLVDAYLWMAEQTVSAIDFAFGWIPGLGGKLDSAKNAVYDFAHAADSALSSFATSAGKWGNQGASEVGKAHDAIKKHTEDTSKAPGGAYSTGLNSTAAGAHAAHAHHQSAHHKIQNSQKAHHKKMLAEAKKAAKEHAKILREQVAAAKAAAKAQEDALRQQLAYAQQQFSFAQQQLVAQSQASIQYVNGQLSNVGLSMLNLGYAGSLASLGGALNAGGSGHSSAPPQIVVHVAGTVVTQQQLVGAVQQGLLVQQRTNSSLGIKTGVN